LAVSLLCLYPRFEALSKHDLDEHVSQHPDGLVVRNSAIRRDRNCLWLRGAVDTFDHDVFAAAVAAMIDSVAPAINRTRWPATRPATNPATSGATSIST
jgi:hypothetical protein